MKFAYQFSNLCGCVYKQGNLVFTADGNQVLSPVGNRVSVFDLVNHKCSTLDIENRKNIERLAMSPDGNTLLSIDEDGNAVLINFIKRVKLCEFNFKKKVYDLKFSPDSQYFAVTFGRHVQVWHAPPLVTQFRPFHLLRTYTGHYADVTTITWSFDSQFFVTGSKDMTVRLYSREPTEGFVPLVMTGHHDHIVGCFFGCGFLSNEDPSSHLYTVSKDGALFVWRYEEMEDDLKVPVKKMRKMHTMHKNRLPAKQGHHGDEHGAEGADKGAAKPLLGRKGRFEMQKKHYLEHNHAKVTCAAHHRPKGGGSAILIVGLSSGIFSLYELPQCNHIHTLSISQQKVSTVTVNPTGDWLAFGCAKIGQLLVWEWQSETYILKQQGHFFGINSIDFSPDGQLLVSGGDDGKVKLWNTTTGFCFVTFSEHSAPIKTVKFSSTGTVVLAASLDGTVRAFDLVRYRNFRTMTTPKPVQFVSLEIDNSGEMVCAGALDPFEIFIWSLQTGRLLDVLSGHTGPVCGLAFNSNHSLLASCSWDKTVRLWDLYSSQASLEALTHSSDVIDLAFRPDGEELASCALDGQIYIWDHAEAKLKCTIDGKKDALGGRLRADPRASVNSTNSYYFNSLCYSADGTCLLAGSNSKYVCIYEVASKMLLKKWCITSNLSLDGMLNQLNSRNMTDAGSLEEIDDSDSEDNDRDPALHSLPGAKTGDYSSRSSQLVMRTFCVKFSPTGMQWCAAATDGLFMYSLDDALVFDPTGLELHITPHNTLHELSNGSYSKALIMALCLNDADLIQEVLEKIPVGDVPLVAGAVPSHRVKRLIEVLGDKLVDSPHLEFYILWVKALLTAHGSYLSKNSTKMLTSFRALHKSLKQHYQNLAKMCSENQYTLQYIGSFASHIPEQQLLTQRDNEAAIQADAEALAAKQIGFQSTAPISKKAKKFDD